MIIPIIAKLLVVLFGWFIDGELLEMRMMIRLMVRLMVHVLFSELIVMSGAV